MKTIEELDAWCDTIIANKLPKEQYAVLNKADFFAWKKLFINFASSGIHNSRKDKFDIIYGAITIHFFNSKFK